MTFKLHKFLARVLYFTNSCKKAVFFKVYIKLYSIHFCMFLVELFFKNFQTDNLIIKKLNLKILRQK